MSVDAKTVSRVAHLARIALPEGEVARMQGEINAMLGFVEQPLDDPLANPAWRRLDRRDQLLV